MGRNKIEVRKIEDRNKRMVSYFLDSISQATFRKRRDGLFKKAHELHLLTGAEVHLTVIHGGKKYHLQRFSDTPRNSEFIEMEYTNQRSFKARVTSGGKGNLISSIDEELNASRSSSDQTDESEAGSVDQNSSPIQPRADRVRTTETTEELLKQMKEYMKYIIIDCYYKKVMKEFRSRTQSKTRNDGKIPHVLTTSTIQQSGKQIHRLSENIGGETRQLPQIGDRAPTGTSYLLPVTIQSTDELDRLSIQRAAPIGVVHDDHDERQKSSSEPVAANSCPLTPSAIQPARLATRPAALSLDLNKSGPLFISPMTEYLEVIQNNPAEALPVDVQSSSPNCDPLSPDHSTLSPNSSSWHTSDSSMVKLTQDLLKELIDENLPDYPSSVTSSVNTVNLTNFDSSFQSSMTYQGMDIPLL